MTTKPRTRGRPVEKPLPPPIPDTLENVARALVATPPKAERDWDYLKDDEPEEIAVSLGRPPKPK